MPRAREAGASSRSAPRSCARSRPARLTARCARAGETRLFITPGYRFRAVDLLLTNFHLPRSTLFMLVAAFAELARMRSAYAYAIGAGYRFYSYGDACLLERTEASREAGGRFARTETRTIWQVRPEQAIRSQA